MNTVLTLLGGSLGVVVPLLFGAALRHGISRAPFSQSVRRTYQRRLVAVIGAWTLVIWGAAVSGVFAYQPGDPLPRFLAPMVLATLVGIGLMANRTFRTILDHTPLDVLVRTQAFRLMGSALFLVVYAGVLPPTFNSAGWGDLATGALAIIGASMLVRRSRSRGIAFWGFTLAGLFDLGNVLVMALTFYPSWHAAPVSTAPLGEFSLVMLPAMAAPIALTLHAYAIRNFVALDEAGSLMTGDQQCLLQSNG